MCGHLPLTNNEKLTEESETEEMSKEPKFPVGTHVHWYEDNEDCLHSGDVVNFEPREGKFADFDEYTVRSDVNGEEYEKDVSEIFTDRVDCIEAQLKFELHKQAMQNERVKRFTKEWRLASGLGCADCALSTAAVSGDENKRRCFFDLEDYPAKGHVCDKFKDPAEVDV